RDGELVETASDTDPLDFVGTCLGRIRVPPRKGLPRFAGGLVGCFGYETVRYIESRLAAADKPDELGTPDIVLLLSEEIAIVDNLSGKLTLVVYADPALPGGWDAAQTRLAELLARLREPVGIPEDVSVTPAPAESSFGE